MGEPIPTRREVLEVMARAPIPMTFGPGQVLYLAAACRVDGVDWPEIEALARVVKRMEGDG